MILRLGSGIFPPPFVFSCLYPFIRRGLDIGRNDPLTSNLYGGDTAGQNQPPYVSGIFSVELGPLAD